MDIADLVVPELGTAKAVWALFKRFWWGLPILGLVLALGVTRHTLAVRTVDRDRVAGELKSERAFGDQIWKATIAASGNKSLARSQTAAQVDQLAVGIGTLRNNLEKCDSSARAAAAADLQRQHVLEQQIQQLGGDLKATRAIADRLRSSAASTIAKGPPAPGICEPSDTLKEIWR